MAEQRYYSTGAAAYNQGSTVFQPVRKTEEERRREEREYIRRARLRVEEKVREKNVEKREVSFLQATAAVSVLALVTLLLVVYVLQVAANFETRADIAELEKQYQSVVKENTLLTTAYENNIDYAEVYRYATESLGMRMPEKQQLVYYTATSSEYVVNNGAIPNE